MPISRRGFLAAATVSLTAGSPVSAEAPAFAWPRGKRAALSLTFDDARVSQIDRGIPFLDTLGVKATFYLTPSRVPERLEGWKKALAAGHELAHHSDSHPCTANYRFSRGNALEDYTLSRMEADLDTATRKLEGMLGIRPVSFAYPCGQKFVGRGEQAASYVPLIAKRFRSGRGYLDEAANDPAVCDLAALMGTGFDGLDAAAMRALLDAAAKEGRWLVLVGHDMGEAAHQSVDLRALETLLRHVQDPASGIWLDTVAAISKHIADQRG
jgi:peptidoglycan/xylan/chitin deacetylase (PgdA/CDA1 family)